MVLKVFALIPARGGSKGILYKNIKPLAGKPLIGWTIDAARQAQGIERIVVSTENEKIAKVARKLGAEVPFLRPWELAVDDTPGIDPVLHAIDFFPGYDWVLLLQPTSPLRSAADIDGILTFCEARGASSVVSLCEVNKHPYWMYRRGNSGRLFPLISDRPNISVRQELPKAYTLNGALYLAQVEWLKKRKAFVGPDTLGYIMPAERSADIDTPQDWQWVEYLIEHCNAK